MSKKSFIDSVKVGSPCSEDWNQMKGSDKTRFCSHCTKHVNNLSVMTRKEAMRLVRASDGNLCIRYIANPETRKPMFAEQLLQITRRAPSVAAGVMSASLSLSTMTYAQGGMSAVSRVAVAEQTVTKDRNVETAGQSLAKPLRLSGTIVDPMGAVIVGAKITISSVDAARALTTTTDENGEYRFDDLQPGKYRIESESPGFRTGVRELAVTDSDAKGDVAMEVGFAITVDVILDVEMEVGVAGGMSVVEYDLPLNQAIANDDLEKVRELLAAGADVNGKDDNYDKITPLFVAVENGNVEIVELLLNFGAKVNTRDKLKQTPLMRLDDDATPELIDLLVRHGAKLNLIDKEGDTALILAAGSADHQLVKALIDAGADVNVKNKEGWTALMNAAEADDLESVRVLLVAGAEVNARNKEGDSAWDLTANDEIEALLESYGAETREKENEEDTPEEP